MAEDRLAEIDDGVGVAVNGLADRSLQLVFAAHALPTFLGQRRRWALLDKAPLGAVMLICSQILRPPGLESRC
jgi:hypothetical protein